MLSFLSFFFIYLCMFSNSACLVCIVYEIWKLIKMDVSIFCRIEHMLPVEHDTYFLNCYLCHILLCSMIVHLLWTLVRSFACCRFFFIACLWLLIGMQICHYSIIKGKRGVLSVVWTSLCNSLDGYSKEQQGMHIAW